MLVEMKVVSLTSDPTTELPILVLRDLEDRRSMALWIGFSEAPGIVQELERIRLTRPTTHDLLRNMVSALGAEVVQVEISEVPPGTIRATIFMRRDGRSLKLDARPSDAVALAMRSGSPILVEEEVIQSTSDMELRSATSAGIRYSPTSYREMLANLPDEEFGKWKM